MSSLHGVVLFGHGSRDPAWRLPMDAVAQRIVQRECNTPVACAFLELQLPDLSTAVDGLVASGVRAVTVLPMFLGVGKHAREDLPKLVEAARRQHPTIDFTVLPAVGEHPEVIDLLAAVALTARGLDR